MKKILILAVAATALVACAKSFDKSTSQGQAIAFDTWNEVLTKARATSDDDTAFQTGDIFDVFGYKTVGSNDYVVFNGDDVEATVSTGSVTWDYDTHRFWDPAAASYTFYAVLPAGNLVDEDTADYWEDGAFQSDDIEFDDPTDFSNDILVADETLVEGVGTGSPAAAPYSYSSANPVEIKFNHIASCVDLLVKQDNKLGDAEVIVTALSLLNISSTGSFEITGYDATSHAPTAEWTEASTPTYLGTSNEYVILDASDDSDDVTASGKTTYDGTTHVGTTTGDAAPIFEGYVFMPQDIVNTGTKQQIKLSYTIQVDSEEPNVYEDVIIDLYDFMKANSTDTNSDSDNNSKGDNIASWETGTHYIYTMTIGANVIEFTASVNDWDDTTITGYQYLLN